MMPTRSEFGPGYPIMFVEAQVDPDEPAYIVASDIWHFLIFLLEKEIRKTEWPFKRESVISQDPSIERFRDVRLPWSADA